MKLSDYKDLVVNRSNDFLSDNSVGIVIKTLDEDDKGQAVYGVYIPRMMMGIPTNEGPFETEVKLSESKCLNSVNKTIGEDVVLSSNYVKLIMFSLYNMSIPRFINGEKVTIGIIDQDIKSMYIKPYSYDQIKKRPSDIIDMYVPASGKYDGDDLTDENTYYCRLDSVNKTIRIHMSNAQKEISQYDIMIDGENGSINITDGVRMIALNTEKDEVYMSNEGGSSISLREDMIDIITNKLYIKADESIVVETPSFDGDMEKIELLSKKTNAEIKDLTVKGKSSKVDYKNAEADYKIYKVSCPTSTFDGLLTVTGFVCAGGIGFGAPPGKPPLPTNPQISKNGMANFKGPGAVPLVKSPALMTILAAFAAQLDAVAAVPIVPVPPLAVTTLATNSGSLMSPLIKG